MLERESWGELLVLELLLITRITSSPKSLEAIFTTFPFTEYIGKCNDR